MDQLEQARQLFLDGLSLQERGDLEQAERLYREALALAPERPSVMNNLATVCLALEKPSEARVLCERVLELNPHDETALLNLGNCHGRLGSARDALHWYDRALSINPRYGDALNNRGNALLELGRAGEALASFDSALAINPGHAEALNNRGNALQELGRAQEALASYDLALAAVPGYAEAHYNRGRTLLELKRAADALASFDRALGVRPGYLQALSSRGIALLELGRPAQALASFDRALALKPDDVDALNNRGDALQAMGRREELIENYRALVRARPDHDYALGHLLRAQLQCCDWTGYEDTAGRVTRAVRADKRAHTPFDFLVISDSADDQLRCAQAFVADKYPAPHPLWRGERYRHDRIRVAYLSADFRSHAVAYLIAGLIEAHDRSRFDVTAISLSPQDDDEMTLRLRTAFKRFIDVHGKSDQEVAFLLRELEIDIAVDLQGFTKGCRPGILSRRPAPVQVNYLGFPGTMGAPCMDYIIADRTVIPADHHSCYAEKVVYLPECYQVNDSKRRIAPYAPSRAEAGLPEQGFVFCCFNNNHKINPRVFGVWMRLLNEVGGSVLWLLEDNQAAAGNLRRQAERSGVAPGRVIFAPRVRMEEHLARHRLADLFLDTLPYNAHVTASDALWTGLPVVTHAGHAFAGRVAASLLKAVGLPELITRSWAEYEELALALAREPARLADVRSRLTQNRVTHPLFDTDRCRRNIESAYVTMWERAQRGESAASFSVPGGL
ncbi:MAG TPA: tetratricopeptide repeat protein [Burkholderiales bacterium]|nr:tetratricopeptide repeat protein [Burkholderiales bacterium]